MGEELLMDARKRCLALSAELGIFAVEVLPIDDEAKRFYLKHGIVPLVDKPLHLYSPMRTIADESADTARDE